MKKLVLSICFLICVNSLTYSQSYFYSESDVLLFLSQASYTNKSSGITLTFTEMATMLSSGQSKFYQPVVTVKSSTMAVVRYSSLTNYGKTASFTVNSTLNVIVDSNDGSVYSFDSKGGGSPDMSKKQQISLPKANSQTEYKVSQTDDGYYVVTDVNTNTPLFHFATDNLFYTTPNNRLGYEQAYELCANANIAGKSDWRLPTFDVLEIIYALRKDIELRSTYEIYWSTTPSVNNPKATKKCIRFSSGAIIEGIIHSSGRIMGYGFENYGLTFAVRDLYWDKYTGSFKSQHPSLDHIEISVVNDSLQLKLSKSSLSVEYKSILKESDTIYFATNKVIEEMKDWKRDPRKVYTYRVFYSKDNSNPSLRLEKRSGQVIKAYKFN